MFIDTHAHLACDELWEEVENLLKRAKEANVNYILIIATDIKDLERAFKLQEKHQGLLVAASTTPHDAKTEEDSFFVSVQQAARSGKLIAIGETGLEYYHTGLDHRLQKKYLSAYLKLAKETMLPVIFHCREGFSDLFSITDMEYNLPAALLHCFSGSIEDAKKALDRGWMISISGIATFKKSQNLQEIIRYIPIEHLVVETDAPYLAPQSRRGKVNEPSFILETYECIATLKNLPVETFAKQVEENVKQLFGPDFFSSPK